MHINTHDFLGPVQQLKVGTINWGFYRFGPLTSSTAVKGSELLLIPGMGLTVASWGTYLLQALAADRTLIVPDNPGMGFSEDTGNASASAEAAVQAYAELIKGLELHRPDILGWSYGGGIGLMLVRSLLQPGNRPWSTAAWWGGWSMWPGTLEDQGGDPGPHTQQALTGRVEDAAEVFFSDTAHGRQGAQWYIDGCKAMPHDPITPATIEQQIQAAIAFHQPGAGIKARLAEIQNDILSIQGSDDDFVPANVADEIINTVPRAFGLRLPGAKHGVLFQYQEFCLAAIRQFLKADR